MNPTMTDTVASAAIGAAARELHLPVVRTDADRLADIAQRSQMTCPLAFLAEVLAAEIDSRTERRRARRVQEARFPRLKRLADFDLAAVPTINPATVAALASGAYLDAGDPIVLLGDSGTGKSHLLIGLGLAACEQGRRVRYATAAQLGQRARRGRRRATSQPHRGPLRTLGPALLGRTRLRATRRPWRRAAVSDSHRARG